MRLNDGLPVWHASVSVLNPKSTQTLDKPMLAEREAIAALRGVGDPEREWWIWNQGAAPFVGHLRVPVTAVEAELIPPGCAVDDAGESGPLRRRRR
jgi:hypothetical protein